MKRHLKFCFSIFQANEVFDDRDDRHTPEQTDKNDLNDRVTVTSQDVALFNSDQALVSTKEKSTKDKVREKMLYSPIVFLSYLFD